MLECTREWAIKRANWCPRAANGSREAAKSDRRVSSDPWRMPEGSKGGKRSLNGSPQRNQVSPRDALGDEKKADMGPKGIQKGVQIGAPEKEQNRALAAARAQSSMSGDTPNAASKPGCSSKT